MPKLALCRVASAAFAFSQLVATACAQTPAQDWPIAGGLTIGIEASSWWLRRSPTPVPLLTDGNLGVAGTSVLLGGGSLDTSPLSGARVTAAYALRNGWSLEGKLFATDSRATARSVESSGQAGSTDLLLPFFNVDQNAENVTEISFSPFYAGSGREELQQSLRGAEFGVARSLAPHGAWTTDLLAGLRYLRLRETYTFSTTSPNLPPYPNDVWNTTDRFDTSNRFYGAQFGLRTRFAAGPWSIGATATLALGTMRETVGIDGALATNDFNGYGPVETFAGGYLALPSNSGTRTRNVFAAVPEVSLIAAYEVLPRLTVRVGYTFLFASDVVRPGRQINRRIDPTQGLAYGGDPPARLQGAALPTFAFDSTRFHAQSVSVGLAWRF